MKTTENVNVLFLQGGKVVDSHSYKGGAKTYLIRMPKGFFIKEDPSEFEYVWIQNFMEENCLRIGGYKNGTLVEVKKKTTEEHNDYCKAIWMKERKNESK